LNHEKDIEQELLLETDSYITGPSDSDKDIDTDNSAVCFISHTFY